jgi:LmbE family N-acetylglucosaminyl deacetylase
MLRNIIRRIYREAIPLVYARSNYKLFLQRSFENLDARIAATLCATNTFSGYIRPVPISAPFGRSMLVVAPHQDDEIIGCGGAMVLQKAARRDVSVVFAQDGGDEHDADGRTRAQQIQIRETEALSVARELDIPPPTFLRYVHLVGEESDRLAADLCREINRTNADVVFTPFFLDYNVHHQRTNFALAEALSMTSRKPRVMGYEIWGLTVPNVILNIDEVHQRKWQLLGMYRSQMTGKDYVHGVKGLNMFHSLHFGSGDCRFAERFFEMTSEDFVRVVRAIRTKIVDSHSGSLLEY